MTAATQTTGPAGGPVHHPAGPVHVDDVRAWVEDRAGKLRGLGDVPGGAPIPLYGSDEWQQLAPNDARRWLSALRAAEAWRHDRDPHVLAARLDVELAAQQQADHDDWAAVREDMTRVGRMLRPDQLQERRAALPANYRGPVSA